MYVLTIRFKDFEPQEIRFVQPPEIRIENSERGCCVYVNGKPYVSFCVPAEGWG